MTVPFKVPVFLIYGCPNRATRELNMSRDQWTTDSKISKILIWIFRLFVCIFLLGVGIYVYKNLPDLCETISRL